MRKVPTVLIAALLATQAPSVALGQTNSPNGGSAAVDTTGASVESHIREGLDAAGRSDWATAIQRFTHAHLLAPDNPVPLYNLGLAQMTAGHHTAAIAWWEAYLAAAPGVENAAKVRAEIERLKRVAIETVRGHFEAAWTALPQLSGPERQSQRSSVELYATRTALLFSPEMTDSVRVSLAAWLREVRAPLAGLPHLAAVTDTARRNQELESTASSLVDNKEFAAARQHAEAITDPARRSNALAKVAGASEAWRIDSVITARLRRREYPLQEITSFIARGEYHAPGGYLYYGLVAKLGRYGFHEEARQLASRVTGSPQREQLLAELAAAKLRAGDFDGARVHGREILDAARLPGAEIMLAATAVSHVRRGETEAGLQIATARLAEAHGLRGHALGAIARIAKQRGDTALAVRAQELQRNAGTRRDVNEITLALAIAEEYEPALALATVADPTWAFFSFDHAESDGMVVDLLSHGAGLEGGLAKIAFVAALRGRDGPARSAVAASTDTTMRYLLHRNIAWGHTVAGRFRVAIESVSRWPLPPGGNRGAETAYHLSRAHVLSAAAVRAARAGRFEDSKLALAALPRASADPNRGALLTRIAAEAAIEVGDAHRAAGDTSSANRLYDMAAEIVRAYRADATAMLASSVGWSWDRLIVPVTARLLRSRPEAASRVAPPLRPEIAAWTRAAFLVSSESPAALLQRLVERDPRELPASSAWAARRIVEDLMTLEAAAPGRLRIPTGVEPPDRDRATARSRAAARPPRIVGTAAWREYPRISAGETRTAAWEPGDHESNEKYHDDWVFQGRAGERVVITAPASIRVSARGPTDTVNHTIAWGQNPLALIVPRDAEYLILIESPYANRTGLYTLAIESSRFVPARGQAPVAGDASLRLNSRCDARIPSMRVSFACPAAWTSTEWSEGTHYMQLNFRHPGDLRINVNVQLISHGIPVQLWGRSAMVYFSADDFLRKRRAEVYGDRNLSAIEELALPNAKWRFFSATVNGDAVSPALGNLLPVDPFLEPPRNGETTGRNARAELPWHWSEELRPLTSGTVHHYAVAGLDRGLIVVTVSGPPEVITAELIRAVASSAVVSSTR